MDPSDCHQIIITKLYNLYKTKGFICEEETLNLLATYKVTLVETDSLMDKLLSMGVIFADDDSLETENVIDKAQSDYAAIYNEIVKILPGEKDFIDYVRNIRPPQNREWHSLIPQSKSGNKYAFNRLFEMYLRSVVRIAYNYYNDGKIELDDAIQEGVIGLMRALNSFDPTKHMNLATYTNFWIMQHIDRSIADTGRTIRIPAHMLETIKKFERDVSVLNEEHVTELTDEELAHYLELTIKEVVTYKQYSQRPLSLDIIVDQQSEEALKDLIIDNYSLSPLEEAERTLLQETVNQALKTLKPKEREVICLRMGFYNGKQNTLDEVGKLFNLTRERIRQIESKALRKLRHSPKSKILFDLQVDE